MLRCFCLALAFLSLGISDAQTQTPKSIPATEIDQAAVDALKEMHNRGAELYNAGDHSGCLKVYGTSILTVKSFLKHRPAIQKLIGDGLTEIEKLDGAKPQAFKLHEVIEKVLAELKAEIKKPVEPELKPTPPLPGRVSGVLTLDGKPVAEATLTITWNVWAFSATTDAEGKFAITDAVPLGKYTAILTGGGVPAKYATTATSELTLEIAAGKNKRDFELKSK